ncbi:MAG: hypothetical protein ABJA10_02915 [Aestuariivirga sp.]
MRVFHLNWKANSQVRDLDDTQKLEITCKVCGPVHYITKRIITKPLELDTICRESDSCGAVRLALVRSAEASGSAVGLKTPFSKLQ